MECKQSGSKGGLENKIYRQVQDKKSFTTKHFERS